jgi:hypothetical protein
MDQQVRQEHLGYQVSPEMLDLVALKVYQEHLELLDSQVFKVLLVFQELLVLTERLEYQEHLEVLV